jgi:hypothetical protein
MVQRDTANWLQRNRIGNEWGTPGLEWTQTSDDGGRWEELCP